MPTNFQHISHVGWDPNHGFDLENVDPNLKKFFQKAGVDEKALQDKDTRDFIYDFIDKHGGVEAALREVNIHRTKYNIRDKGKGERTLLLLLLFVRLSLLSPLFSFQQLLLNLWWKLEAREEEL